MAFTFQTAKKAGETPPTQVKAAFAEASSSSKGLKQDLKMAMLAVDHPQVKAGSSWPLWHGAIHTLGIWVSMDTNKALWFRE